MSDSNMIKPPIFKDGDMEYKDWRKDVMLWTLLTDLPKSKMAIAVYLSLSGRARTATSELTEDELKANNGLTTLLARLDKVYLQDANWNIFDNYLTFEKFCRGSETSIEDFFHEFDQQCCMLKKCGVELPEAVLACRLLRSFNLSDVHFQLVLTTISYLTLDDMRKALKRLFTDDGIICIPKDNEECLEFTENIKVEPVRFSEVFQENDTYNNKQLEGSSSYCERMKQKKLDKSHTGEAQSITGEIEHIVVNQSNAEDVEHEQEQFCSNRVDFKEELPDYVEGLENPEENFDTLDYPNQNHDLCKQNDQQKTANNSDRIGNPEQTSFYDNESIDCWLRRNLCTVKIKNLDPYNIKQTKQQNKGNNLDEELSKTETKRFDRNNLQGFKSEMSSQARKSGRRAKLPEKFKEYVDVPPKKKSQPLKAGHTQSSEENFVESNANIISTIEKQELFQSKMSSLGRKSGRQAKLPKKFKEYLYVPPKKNSHSHKIRHTQSSELNTNRISTVIMQEDVNTGNMSPEGLKEQKITRYGNFHIYYKSPCVNKKNIEDMNVNSTPNEGKTPDHQDHASGSANDQDSYRISSHKLKRRCSIEHKPSFVCSHCPKSFRCHRNYLQHLKEHTKSKIHKCTQCSRSFESEQLLAIHLLHHRNPATIGPFICSYCSREFDHKYSWQRHVYLFHENKDSKVVGICNACKLSFRSNSMFRRHRLKYHREEVNKEENKKKEENKIKNKMKRRFKVCPYCNKEFIRGSFYGHLRKHKEEREEYICSHCGKSFSNKGNLRRHNVNYCTHLNELVCNKNNFPVKQSTPSSSTDSDPSSINAGTFLEMKNEKNC